MNNETEKAKHTPGEWQITGRYGTMVQSADQKYIADVFYRTPDDSEAKSNAQLIAAAPALYRELERLVILMEPLEREGGLGIPGLATLNGARAAIAKATVCPPKK
jgi:hypothetical protein